jgi:tetratricopeptide (TPR) repeat protein
MRLLAFIVALFCCAISARADEQAAFTRANEEFAGGHFQEAIQLYDSIVQSGRADAAVFYNLGNAWYRSGNPGRAILNYQRALALDPNHPEAQANLRLVREKSRALELRRTGVERAVERARSGQLSVAAAAGFWIGVLCLAGTLMTRRRTTLAVIGVLSLLIGTSAAAALYLRETGSSGRTVAIVVEEKTEARVATADSAGSVLTLPPGSEVQVLSTRGDWIYAALPNDLRGWIPAASAERVRL